MTMQVNAPLYPGPYYEYRIFMERTYGKVLHKVPVDFNYGCPHRTPEHHGGCTFCPEDGSRATQIDGLDTLTEQIDAAVAFAKHRYKATGFTAYVQAYTATFAPVSKFREQMAEILSLYPFDSLHLGTRPDCLPKSTLEYLSDLSKKIDLWVELGLQTSHDKTLLRIQREHDWACSLKGIEKLKNHGLQVVSHVILGLPGETHEDMIETAKAMAQQPLDGIKIHNLHVLANTQLAEEYKEQGFHIMGELEYIHLIAEFIRHLPPELPVMRINTDTPPKELIAPHWTLQKGQMKERIITHMKRLGIQQGDLYVGKPSNDQQYKLTEQGELNSAKLEKGRAKPSHILKETMDGSFTLLQTETGEPLHPRWGAARSIQERFIAQLPLERFKQKSSLKVLDIGFGTGITTALLCEHLRHQAPNSQVDIEAFEQDRRALLTYRGQYANELKTYNDMLHRLTLIPETRSSWTSPHGQRIKLHWGDARYYLQAVQPGSVDLIVLDPCDEKNNTELVSLELFQWLHHLLKDDGLLLCSRTHPAVVQSAKQSGFRVMETETKVLKLIKTSSGELSTEMPNDVRATVYRDPELCWGHKDIVRDRNKRIEELKIEQETAIKA